MRNQIRPYAWGSRTAIAELLGEPSPSPHPQAELWMGAHPHAPSTLLGDDEQSLLEHIAADPHAALGEPSRAAFGDRFPFLLKVLAAGEPLSLQAHPSAEQARLGFAAEEEAGIPPTDPRRNYTDPWPKPELICALTDLDALCGFAEPEHTVAVLQELGVPELDRYLTLLAGQPDEEGTRALFSTLITIPSSAILELLSAVLEACVAKVREGTSRYLVHYRTAMDLAERYRDDAGVLASFMLNRLTLRPGEAIYLPSGNLHAYLSGSGVEIMGNSDNVLRGGLTPKHVDVPELMRVLDFRPGPVTVLTPRQISDAEAVYDADAPEFRLSRLSITEQRYDLTHNGPQIVLITEGSATVRVPGTEPLAVRRGQSVWIAAADVGATISGSGTAFRALDGVAA